MVLHLKHNCLTPHMTNVTSYSLYVKYASKLSCDTSPESYLSHSPYVKYHILLTICQIRFKISLWSFNWSVYVLPLYLTTKCVKIITDYLLLLLLLTICQMSHLTHHMSNMLHNFPAWLIRLRWSITGKLWSKFDI
jgi:hypothetical protein